MGLDCCVLLAAAGLVPIQGEVNYNMHGCCSVVDLSWAALGLLWSWMAVASWSQHGSDSLLHFLFTQTKRINDATLETP